MDGSGVMICNREKWNSLYKDLNNEERDMATVQSVPEIESWGKTTEDKILEESIRDGDVCILDIGTGIGAHLATALLANPQMSAIGFDISDVAVEIGNKLIVKNGFQNRMKIMQAGLLDDWSSRVDRKYDIVSAICCLQFCRMSELDKLTQQIKKVVMPNGRFVCKCRSTSRDVPDTYSKCDEENTYISHELHEYGMIYHHYSKEDMLEMARMLGGKVVLLREELKYREYDKFPRRGWWEMVVDFI